MLKFYSLLCSVVRTNHQQRHRWFFWSGTPCDWVFGPVGDILSGVEKIVRVHKAVMILTGFSRPTVKLVGVRRKLLSDLCAEVDLAMLAAKSNALVVLNAI